LNSSLSQSAAELWLAQLGQCATLPNSVIPQKKIVFV